MGLCGWAKGDGGQVGVRPCAEASEQGVGLGIKDHAARNECAGILTITKNLRAYPSASVFLKVATRCGDHLVKKADDFTEIGQVEDAVVCSHFVTNARCSNSD
jgi:hypothetical protein